MIILYSTNCPKCNVINMKLKQLSLDYTIVEDQNKVVEIGKLHNINSAPILQVDDNYFDFTNAIKYLKEIQTNAN